MKSLSKVFAFSMMAVLAACAGTAESGDEAAAPGADEKNQTSDTPSGSAAATDNAGPINTLIASAGTLNTTDSADAEPKQTGDAKKETVTGANGIYQCTYTNYSLTKVPEKFVALNPNADVLWPGSLIQGKSMASGILDPIPVKRAPGTITLTLASGGGGPFHKTMPVASLANALEAENAILAAYDGATPAKFSYSFESIYSSEQLAVAVDANVKGTNWSAAAALSVDKKDEKSRVLIQFSQEYFTMAFDPPQGAAGVFDPSVTAADLAPYTQAGNPPVYVSGVTYGRMFYILFESSASQIDLDTAVKGSYSGAISADLSVQAKWKSTINSATVKSYGLGGNAAEAIGAVTGNDQFTKIQKFLTTGANFDKANPGVPISYTIRNLTDASQVRLALTTEYTAKDCTPMANYCDGAGGHVLDKCGVCGGDDSTCDGCAAGSVQRKGDGVYVNFNVGEDLKHGESRTFADGNYYKYDFPRCHQMNWGNVQVTCTDGKLDISRGGFSTSARCDLDSNASWKSGNLSISTGYQP